MTNGSARLRICLARSAIFVTEVGERFDRRLEALDPLLRDPDRLDHLPQRNLVGGMAKLLFLKPSQITHGPGLRAREDPAMLEHEAAHLLAMDALSLDCGGAGAPQIAHRLVAFVWDPNRRELAGPQEPRQGDGVTAVGLDPITRLPRDQ